LTMRGDANVSFEVGYQSGRWEDNNQVSNFVQFGPKTSRKLGSRWIDFKIPMSDLDKGGSLKDIGNILSILGKTQDPDKKIYIKNIYYTQD
jgi:hypothetical protein